MSAENFELAAEEIKNFIAGNGKVSDDNLLQFYAFYKQGTVGDCNTDKPGMLALKDKAKWEAWNAKKGMNQNDAKTEYVKLAKTVLPANVASNL
ncbi:hypothetical protein IMG5_023240 [Ichthyophthirius multifiliis]|uniref:ACB domain-containing protein n=1 Tax=Ichthyophthirius multifiliis TaxID=5932 RepID=G0QKY9_ICHMU|nr:hypothetical protein IMG5_023240 [Ichthyophthirius multifiliis]EGR34110.1 hypothetical protein IMG5_023240 [Ichthyophthirius multifiliis]|eukprot:XP_004039414.1 hypothetical protein IMG5_023240 [Ichthyophthirius multifiliis]